jgi:hypothetical protein
MADDILIGVGNNATPPGGTAVRSLEDGSGRDWPAGVTAYAVTLGTPNVLQVVTPSAGLPVQPSSGATFPVSISAPVTITGPVDVTPATPAASDYLPVRLTSGTAFDPVLSVAGTVAATQSGAWSVGVTGSVTVTGSVDVTPAAPAAGDYLPVRLTDGANFYAATGGGGGAGTSITDRGTFTAGSTALTPGGGLFDDTPPAALTAGMAGTFRITAQRALHVHLRDTAGAALGTAALPLRVDPTGTTSQPVSGTVSVGGVVDVTPAAPAAGDYLPVRLTDGTNFYAATGGGGGAGTSLTDRGTFTTGTTPLTPVGGLFDDTPPADLTTGMAGAVRLTPKRAQHTNLRNQAGAEVGTSSAPLRTDPTGTTAQPVSGTVTANAGTGTFTVGGTVTANAGTGTFTVGGTVTSNIGTTGGLLLDTTFTARTPVPGQATMANSSPVVIASNQSALPVSGTITANAGTGTFNVAGTVTANAGTGTWSADVTDRAARLAGQVETRKASVASAPSRVAVGTTAVIALASNAARRGLLVQNAGTTVIKLTLGTVDPTATVYHVALKAGAAADDGLGGTYIDDQFTGAVRAISSAAGGAVVVLEVT